MRPLVIAERFRYRKCVQKSGQTVAEYAAELHQLAAKCDFGDRLDEALRDGFVGRVSSEACQRKLLSEDRLTFARAVELAVNIETAHRDAQQLRKGDDVTALHKIKERRRSLSEQEGCYRCKGKGHSASDCYYKDVKWHKCGNVGHIQKACRTGGQTRERQEKKGKRNSVRKKKKMTGYVQADEMEDDIWQPPTNRSFRMTSPKSTQL
uniref:CCHC-type domain-containing protein n=1 Tax=Gasterosteus aculeatus aculeatus TaxID=481459 RepID=A0AAQ4P6G0_GASAC